MKGELKILQNAIAQRTEITRTNPFKTIDMFLQKFEHEIVEFDINVGEIIDSRFNRSKLINDKCDKMYEIIAIDHCLRKNAETVASNMEIYADRVVKLAVVLNYLLESINYRRRI